MIYPAKKTPQRLAHFGQFYQTYIPNKQTTWYAVYFKKGNKFLVTHIFNNHCPESGIRQRVQVQLGPGAVFVSGPDAASVRALEARQGMEGRNHFFAQLGAERIIEHLDVSAQTVGFRCGVHGKLDFPKDSSNHTLFCL